MPSSTAPLMSWTLNLPKGGTPPFGPCQGASRTFCDLSVMAAAGFWELVSAVAVLGFFCSVAHAQPRATATKGRRRIIWLGISGPQELDGKSILVVRLVEAGVG